eukprot:26104_1
MLLATFNSSLSNFTIFKCDNRFDRTIEEMFNKFQLGVKIMSGSENCFMGRLMFIIKDVIASGATDAKADFKNHIRRLANDAPVIINAKTKEEESAFFVAQMYKAGLTILPYPPLGTEYFFQCLNTKMEKSITNIDKKMTLIEGGNNFLDHIKLLMSKFNIGDWASMSDERAKMRIREIEDNLKNAAVSGSIFQPNNEYATFNLDDEQHLKNLDKNKVIDIEFTLNQNNQLMVIVKDEQKDDEKDECKSKEINETKIDEIQYDDI